MSARKAEAALPATARRRADGRARLPHRRNGPAAPACALRRRRRWRARDPRGPLRRVGRPGRLPARWHAGRRHRPRARGRDAADSDRGLMLSALRAAVRIARRDAWRAPGRSALVVAMIALPVMGATVIDVVARTQQLDPADVVDRELGAAQARVEQPNVGVTARTPGAIVQTPAGDYAADDRRLRRRRLMDVLPAESRLLTDVSRPTVVRTDDGVRSRTGSRRPHRSAATRTIPAATGDPASSPTRATRWSTTGAPSGPSPASAIPPRSGCCARGAESWRSTGATSSTGA